MVGSCGGAKMIHQTEEIWDAKISYHESINAAKRVLKFWFEQTRLVIFSVWMPDERSESYGCLVVDLWIPSVVTKCPLQLTVWSDYRLMELYKTWQLWAVLPQQWSKRKNSLIPWLHLMLIGILFFPHVYSLKHYCICQNSKTSNLLFSPHIIRLNAAYLAVHGSAILGRPMWLTTSALARQTSAVSGSQ